MEAELMTSLRDLDPAVLGGRIKAARIAAGLTQGELAGDDVSVAYISRIESGQRRPDGALLEALATRLSTTPDTLVLGSSGAHIDELRLELDFAELALETGDAAEAIAKAEKVRAGLEDVSLPELTYRARYVYARGLESSGDLDGAIIELEELRAWDGLDLAWLKVIIALTRCYRESGDLGRSIETGEAGLRDLEQIGLAQSDEAIQLTVSVAASYGFRGDVGHGARMCRKAIGDAEESGTPAARAAAYWNASYMESLRGRTQAAISLAAKALDLFAQTNDVRNRALLRSTLGMYQLEATPAELPAAKHNLRAAIDELTWTSATPLDVGHTMLALAKAHLLDGEAQEAHTLLAEVRAMGQAESPLLLAESRAMAGQIALGHGDVPTANYEFAGAVAVLTSLGADRDAAQLWFDLGGLLDQVGDGDGARNAYKFAAAATGLNPTVPVLASRQAVVQA